jgi:O-antigen/teichoic acid export membrane protein
MKKTSVRRDSIETVAAGVLGQGTLMISGILIARLLGVENRGHLALMTLFPLILAAIGTLGLPVASTYYIAQRSDARRLMRELAPSAVRQALVVQLVQVAVLNVVFHDTGHEVEVAAAYTLLGMPAFVTLTWGLAILQGQHRFRAFNLCRLIQPMLYSAVAVVAYAAHVHDLRVIALGWAVTFLVAGVWTLWESLRGLPEGGEEPPPLRELYRFGLRGMIGWASPLETFQLDQLVVGIALSPHALGLYVVGAAFTNLTRLFIPQSLGMVAYPHVATKTTPASARTAVWKFFFLALVVCAGFVVVLELLMGWAIPLFFGDAFRASVPLARILLLGSIFLGVRRVLTDGTRGAGFPALGTIAEFFTAGIAIPALVIGGQQGVEGVAWALTISYGLGLVALIAMAMRKLGGAPDEGRRRSGDLAPATGS